MKRHRTNQASQVRRIFEDLQTISMLNPGASVPEILAEYRSVKNGFGHIVILSIVLLVIGCYNVGMTTLKNVTTFDKVSVVELNTGLMKQDGYVFVSFGTQSEAENWLLANGYEIKTIPGLNWKKLPVKIVNGTLSVAGVCVDYGSGALEKIDLDLSRFRESKVVMPSGIVFNRYSDIINK